MSSTVAPSRSTCFTFEFMNTVHLVPRSHGADARHAASENSETVYPKPFAKVSMNEPHPEEQASLISIRSMTPPLTKIAFMSCPPMSRMKVTSASKWRAAT